MALTAAQKIAQVKKSTPATNAKTELIKQINAKKKEEIARPPEDPNAALRRSISSIYDPLISASNASITARRAGIGADFSNLANRLRETAGQSTQALTEGLNRYGLLQSGRTAAGMGKIQENLASDIQKSDIERTIAEANLVLEGAQYESQVRTAGLQEFERLKPDSLEQQKLKLSQELQKYNIDLSKFKTVQDLYSNPFNTQYLPDQTLKQMLESLGYRVTA